MEKESRRRAGGHGNEESTEDRVDQAMKQLSLWNFRTDAAILAPGTRVVDLFCGVGGFSCGAAKAGHPIVLAVDSNEVFLKAHERNHPNCQHILAEMPCELPFPTSGEWHLHCSPPCTKLSIMNNLRYDDETDEALQLVRWSIGLVKNAKPTSWSLEQVMHGGVIDMLDELKRKHPLTYDYEIVDAYNYEVPQHRKRLIAGSPHIIRNLREFTPSKRVCVRDVIPNPPREWIRNNLYSRPHHKTKERVAVPFKDTMRSVDGPCFVALATGHRRWATKDGEVLRHLNAEETALIQTFPSDYKLPKSNTLGLVAVGNAVPPRVAEIMMAPTKANKQPRL